METIEDAVTEIVPKMVGTGIIDGAFYFSLSATKKYLEYRLQIIKYYDTISVRRKQKSLLTIVQDLI